MGTEKRQRQKQGRIDRLARAEAEMAKKKRNRLLIIAGGALVLVVAVILATSGLNGKDSDETVDAAASSTTLGSTTTVPPYLLPPGATITGETPCPAADGSAERTTTFAAPPPNCLDPAKSYAAVFTTNVGVIRVALDTATTPIATNNFVVLARYHYYDGTIITRTATDIGIVQGGSPTTQTNSDPGPGYTIEDEGFDDAAGVSGSGGPYRYKAGDLVYARPGGQPDSSSAQFFFCANDNCSNLDSQGIYINFGSTTEGLEVIQAILASAPEGDAQPNETVTVETVTIEEN